MPFVYEMASKQGSDTWGTSGTPATEVDHSFIKPHAARGFGLVAVRVQGRTSGATTLSGISIRLKHFTTTSSVTSSTGSSLAVTAQAKNRVAPAVGATMGMATASNGLIQSGTGGPLMVGFASMGASGPGGWVAINPDDVPYIDFAGTGAGPTNGSLDLFSASSAASLTFEAVEDIQEC